MLAPKATFKHKLLKLLNILGLQVFEPLVRLCYWEEPRTQFRKIGLYLLIPIVTFAFFLAIWGYLAPRHTTKSGEVPTPQVVWDAALGIWRFHERENRKQADYFAIGEARTKALQEVESRLIEIEPLLVQADDELLRAEQDYTAYKAEKMKPFEQAYAEARDSIKAKQEERKNALLGQAKQLDLNMTDAYASYQAAVAEHLKISEQELNDLKAMSSRLNREASRIPEELRAARRNKTALAEEKQYLIKRSETLSTENKELKISELKAGSSSDMPSQLDEDRSAIYAHAVRQVKLQERIDRLEKSSFAKPWTFPEQIYRSIGCVFLGFIIASAIAIPVGIFCGLSPIFMSAMTPLVSLFKPVSPIVWLPIIFIIVGGFIEKPEEAWIHPAFLSSAITVALCSLWPTLVNTALGVSSIDKDHLNVARVLQLGFWSRLFRIVIPSALPLIFAGLRISLGVGWMVLIAAELLSSSEGIGKFVWDMFNNGSSETFAQMFVVVFVVGPIGLLLDRIMIVCQRLVSFDNARTAI